MLNRVVDGREMKFSKEKEIIKENEYFVDFPEDEEGSQGSRMGLKEENLLIEGVNLSLSLKRGRAEQENDGFFGIWYMA